jgi:hypothetical protein
MTSATLPWSAIAARPAAERRNNANGPTPAQHATTRG